MRAQRGAISACVMVGVTVLASRSLVGPTRAGPARAAVFGATTSRVSIGADGTEGTEDSYQGVVSAHGRYVAFTSRAALVPGQSSEDVGVYVRDRLAGTVSPVSVDRSGALHSGFEPSISADGRFIAFTSPRALTPNATDGLEDVYVRDMVAGTTRLVSVSSSGVEGGGVLPAISADGQHVAFLSPANNLAPGANVDDFDNVYVRDLVTRTTELVSVPHGARTIPAVRDFLEAPAISRHGRLVAFSSPDDNLVPNDTNNARDVFVRDRKTRTTTRLSVSGGGAQGNADSGRSESDDVNTLDSVAISADGRAVAFVSFASNLVRHDTNGNGGDVFVRDLATGVIRLVSRSTSGAQGSSSGTHGIGVSGNGRFVTFSSGAALVPGDTNGRLDIFVRDRWLGTTRLVSVPVRGQQVLRGSFDPAISRDGRHISFTTIDQLVPADTNDDQDIYVRDAFGDFP